RLPPGVRGGGGGPRLMVGIDHLDPGALAEPAGDRGLAAADWPGDADGQHHGARSSSSSHASSAVASAAVTSASSLVTRRSSTKFAAIDGSPIASSRWFFRNPRRVSSASSAVFWRRYASFDNFEK